MKFLIAVFLLVLSNFSFSFAGCFEFLNDLSPKTAASNFRKAIQNSEEKVDQEIDAHQRVIQSLQKQKQFLIEEDKKVVDMANFLSSGPYKLSGLRPQIKMSSNSYVYLLAETDKAEKYIAKTQIQYHRAAGKILQTLRNIFESIAAEKATFSPPLFEVLEQLRNKRMEGTQLRDADQIKLSTSLEKAAEFESLSMWDMAYSIYQNISEQFTETKEGISGCDLALVEIYKRTIDTGELMKAMLVSGDDVVPDPAEGIFCGARKDVPVSHLVKLNVHSDFNQAEIEGIGLGSERKIFDQGIDLFNEDKWQSAYDLFKQAWKVFNKTEADGHEHSLAEVFIVDYVQYTAFKVGRIDEARATCLWALNHLPLTDEQRKRFEVAVKVYQQELLHLSSPKGKERGIFDKAFNLLNEEKWEEAYHRFMQAWKVYNETETAGHSHSLEEVYIVDYVQYSAYKANKIEEAHNACLHALNHIALTSDQRQRFEAAFDTSDQRLSSIKLEVVYQKIDNVTTEEQIKMAKIALSSKIYNLCQEEPAYKAMKILSENAKLICRYDNRKRHPMLILSPAKEEILSLSPIVILVHGLILEKEIQSFKDSAEGKLVSAKIANLTSQQRELQEHVLKSRRASIETATMPALTARLEAALGINPYGEACETYQVGHYKIGGHFVPHVDILFNKSREAGFGDRIATLLLYLNDVEQGGGTVFPELRLRVNATKGSGLFWYNFHKNETANFKTIHGACPVIRGEKWTTAKWYRWRGQLAHITQGLKKTDDFTLEDLNLPPELQYRTVKNTEPGVRYSTENYQ